MGWRERVDVLKLPADTRGRIALLRLAAGRPRTGIVAIRITALGGQPVHLRPRTTDLENLIEGVIAGYAQPPREAPTPLTTVVEIGTNIGIGLALIAARNPGASVYGVEADADNLALARATLAPFDATLLHAAAWDENTTVEIVKHDRGASGFQTQPASSGVPARTLTHLLDELVPHNRPIDYLHLDIEGAHARAIKAEDTTWAARVHTIKVAGHAGTPYDEHECAHDLQRLGFTTRVEPYDPIGWTIGARTARPQTDTS